MALLAEILLVKTRYVAIITPVRPVNHKYSKADHISRFMEMQELLIPFFSTFTVISEHYFRTSFIKMQLQMWFFFHNNFYWKINSSCDWSNSSTCIQNSTLFQENIDLEEFKLFSSTGMKIKQFSRSVPTVYMDTTLPKRKGKEQWKVPFQDNLGTSASEMQKLSCRQNSKHLQMSWRGHKCFQGQ